MAGPSHTVDFDNFSAELVLWARESGKVANRVIDEESKTLLNVARASAVNVTGDFRNSFTRDTRGRFRNGSYARRVYSTDPGGMAIEYGTAHQPPQPALSIHADQSAANVEARLIELLPGFPK